jgi:TRAP-type transport system small permease protein
MIKRLEQGLLFTNRLLLGLIMSVMFILVFGNVLTRYLFDFSLNWAEEVSRYLMIWLAYLGLGIAMRQGNHVAVEMLQERLPRVATRLLRAFVGVVLMLFMGFLAYLGFKYSAFAMNQETAALQLPMGLVYLAVPLGCVVFLLHMCTIFREFVDKQPGFEPPHEETAGQEGA